MTPSSTPTPANAPNGSRRRAFAVLALALGAVALGAMVLWLLVWSRRETTDDAYVAGNRIQLSAQLSGTVVAVLTDTTQRVQAGQVLVRLDATDAEAALQRAAAQLARTVRQIHEQTATAAQFDALSEGRATALSAAEADLAGREPLLKEQAIAAEEVRHARDAVSVARSALQASRRQAEAAHQLIDGTELATNPAVLEAKAAYVQAWLNRQRTAIIAPASGYIAERTVQVGQHIQSGENLLTVVGLENLWVDANFKEAQLRTLRIGQPALVTCDLYGSEVAFHGKVIGAAPGTGAAFALLPPQNASGNWIKIVQRVPVRIALDPAELAQHPLRVGLSAEVQVNIRDRSGPVLAPSVGTEAVASTEVYAGDLAAANAAADAIVRSGRAGRT